MDEFKLENGENFTSERYVSGSKGDAPGSWVSGVVIGLCCGILSALKAGENIYFNVTVENDSQPSLTGILFDTSIMLAYQSILSCQQDKS